MKRFLIPLIAIITSCHHPVKNEAIAVIQIQDRNGLTETISNPDRLTPYQSIDFLSTQPYRKVTRIYKEEGKNRSKITTYHPNGIVFQYLEAEEMRAHGTYREWFPNGQLRLEATVIGGTADLAPGVQEDWVFDSLSRVWDEQGNLVAEIPYEKGVLSGKSVYYYPSGQVERELSFDKNKLDGLATEYWPSGIIKSTTFCKKGVKEGESVGYFEGGALSWKEDYLDGRLRNGIYYNSQGETVSEVENGGGFQALFENGAMTLTEYKVGLPEGVVKKISPAGELQKIYSMKNGKKQGEEIEYYLSQDLEDSKEKLVPKLSISWHENAIHGCVKTWYNNGQLQSQREYSRNHRSGPSLAWYRDGSLMIYEEYEEDRLLTGQYYKIQRKDPISSIINGNGVATLHDETGAFIRKVPYLKGKPVDPED